MDNEKRYGIMIQSQDGRERYSMARFKTKDLAEKYAQSMLRRDPDHIYIYIKSWN